MEAWNDPESFLAIQALRHTLRGTEEKLGRWEVGLLGMALLILSTHWEPAGEPQSFFDSMTPIEQNLYLDVAAIKLAEMQTQAQTPTEEWHGRARSS